MSDAIPRHASSIPLPERPHLFVIVDTEEEFDWNAPPSREATTVLAMRHVGRAQQIFDRYGLRPTYVIDYPVASQQAGYEPLQEIHRDGRCHIGGHLHPWVSPPYTEQLSGPNTFMMNIGTALQAQKLEALTAAITDKFGQPRVFKAGRYGLGRDTVELLDSMGYLVDTSVCPRMDFSELQGPSFAGFDSSPFMLTPRLMELPCTVDYIGWIGHRGRTLHTLASSRPLRRLRGVGVLARTGAVNRVMLSPEGNTLQEMRDLARALARRGCRTFTLSFHSPSVDVGHTPYVRTQQDLQNFLDRIDRFCEFFMTDLRGVPDSSLDFYNRVIAHRTGQPV